MQNQSSHEMKNTQLKSTRDSARLGWVVTTEEIFFLTRKTSSVMQRQNTGERAVYAWGTQGDVTAQLKTGTTCPKGRCTESHRKEQVQGSWNLITLEGSGLLKEQEKKVLHKFLLMVKLNFYHDYSGEKKSFELQRNVEGISKRFHAF